MENKILSLTKSLISIPSVKGDTKALHEVLELAKKELGGFTIEKFESNGIESLLAYAGKTRPKKFRIILNAHLDVVPGKPQQFKPFEKDGKLFGRGTYDMKAGAAVMILVFRELAKKLKYPIGLQIVTDEEIGGANGTKYQIAQNILTDFVIAGENSNFTVKTEAKGIFWVKVTSKGKTGHGAYPWLGKNALMKVIEGLEKLTKIFPIPTKDSWQTTINIARIETPNSTFNKIPEEATVWLDVRFISKDKEKFLSVIEKSFAGMDIHFIEKESSALTDRSNAYVQLLTKTIQEVLKRDVEKHTWHGASDVRFYSEKGMAGVEFGPIGANHHADNEWVDIKSLEDYYNILKEFLSNLKSS